MNSLKTLAFAATAALTATFTQAATYDITGVVNTTANGFGSSGFHDQNNGQMSGAYYTRFTSAMGSWDDMSGAISFSGTLMDGASYSASGVIERSTTRAPDGIFGSITFDITGSGTAGLNGVNTFYFADSTFGTEPNNVFGGAIALWGDLGNYSAQNTDFMSGLDMRLTVSEVPLPAAGWMLLAALGGLAASQRRKQG